MTVTQTSNRARFGTRVLARSGFTMLVSRPAEEVQLWNEYLTGAANAYQRQRCSRALDVDAIADGASTELFFTIVDADGAVRGGLRVQPRLTAAAQSHALEEWRGSSAQVNLVNAIESRLHEGVVEVKSAWVDDRSPIAGAAVGQMALLGLPIMTLCEVEHVMATAADHVLRRWESGGGRVDVSVAPTPYPSDRYRTQLMWWHRATLRQTTTVAAWNRMCGDVDVLCGRRVAG